MIETVVSVWMWRLILSWGRWKCTSKRNLSDYINTIYLNQNLVNITIYNNLTSSSVSSDDKLAVWTLVLHILQTVNAERSEEARPEPSEAEDSTESPGHHSGWGGGGGGDGVETVRTGESGRTGTQVWHHNLRWNYFTKIFQMKQMKIYLNNSDNCLLSIMRITRMRSFDRFFVRWRQIIVLLNLSLFCHISCFCCFRVAFKFTSVIWWLCLGYFVVCWCCTNNFDFTL